MTQFLHTYHTANHDHGTRQRIEKKVRGALNGGLNVFYPLLVGLVLCLTVHIKLHRNDAGARAIPWSLRSSYGLSNSTKQGDHYGVSLLEVVLKEHLPDEKSNVELTETPTLLFARCGRT